MQAGAPLDDDDPETFPCYRHPGRETALRCLECDRPICVDCAVQGAVGIKCPECARTSRAARGAVPADKLLLGASTGVIVAVLLGPLLWIFHVPFIGIILAMGIGAATGEATRRASGGYRDPVLARIAAGAAFVGVGALPVLALVTGAFSAGVAFGVLGAVLAAVTAFNRAS